jgi:hypothetical protein
MTSVTTDPGKSGRRGLLIPEDQPGQLTRAIREFVPNEPGLCSSDG